MVINFGHNYYSYTHCWRIHQILGVENKYAEMKLVSFPSLKWILLIFFPCCWYVFFTIFLLPLWFLPIFLACDSQSFWLYRRINELSEEDYRWNGNHFCLSVRRSGGQKTNETNNQNGNGAKSHSHLSNQINWGVSENLSMVNLTIWNDQRERERDIEIISLSIVTIINGTNQTVAVSSPTNTVVNLMVFVWTSYDFLCSLLGWSVKQKQQTVETSYVWATNMCMKSV